MEQCNITACQDGIRPPHAMWSLWCNYP